MLRAAARAALWDADAGARERVRADAGGRVLPRQALLRLRPRALCSGAAPTYFPTHSHSHSHSRAAALLDALERLVVSALHSLSLQRAHSVAASGGRCGGASGRGAVTCRRRLLLDEREEQVATQRLGHLRLQERSHEQLEAREVDRLHTARGTLALSIYSYLFVIYILVRVQFDPCDH